MKSYKRVALIGLDGSGKSANIDRMKSDADYLETDGVDCALLCFLKMRSSFQSEDMPEPV